MCFVDFFFFNVENCINLIKNNYIEKDNGNNILKCKEFFILLDYWLIVFLGFFVFLYFLGKFFFFSGLIFIISVFFGVILLFFL